MKNSFYEEAVKKLMDYKRKYPDKSFKGAIKICGYSAFWALKNIFVNKIEQKKRTEKSSDDTLKVAFILTNMLGDVLVNLRYLQRFYCNLPQGSKLDVYTNLKEEVINGLLYQKDFINTINKGRRPDIRDYDLIIDIDRYPELVHYSERVKTGSNDFFSNYISVLERFYVEHPVFYLNGSWGDRIGIEYAELNGKTRHTQSDIYNLLKLEETEYYLEADPVYENVLGKNGLEKKRFITLQRGIAGKGEYTRLWSLENYKVLVGKIKKENPEYKLVQLGREDTLKIDGIDLDLRGKTNFEELKNILKYALIHIDGDCGMVHIRHALQGGVSVVLFGPTSPDFIGYPENLNLRGDGCPGYCEWVNIDWQEKCARGFKDLPCMISPERVFEKVKALMKK